MAAHSKAAADKLARACAETMWPDDNATNHLGFELFDVSSGCAAMRVTVRPEMANGHGICHGGFMFTLADSTFAFACNTYDQRTVAQQCAVTFLAAVPEGETLTAHAVERNRAGRGGIYDVTVRDSSNKVVAEFRGHSRTISGRLLDDHQHDHS